MGRTRKAFVFEGVEFKYPLSAPMLTPWSIKEMSARVETCREGARSGLALDNASLAGT